MGRGEDGEPGAALHATGGVLLEPPNLLRHPCMPPCFRSASTRLIQTSLLAARWTTESWCGGSAPARRYSCMTSVRLRLFVLWILIVLSMPCLSLLLTHGRSHLTGKPIASIAFHPSGKALVVASGHKVCLRGNSRTKQSASSPPSYLNRSISGTTPSLPLPRGRTRTPLTSCGPSVRCGRCTSTRSACR